MEEILSELGMHELLNNFVSNEVGPAEVLLLTDADFLNLGVTTVGKRVRLRNRCRVEVDDSSDSSRVVERIRDFQNRRLGRARSSNHVSRQTNPGCKNTRRVLVGWKHRKTPYLCNQITAPKGGGTHPLDLNKNTSLTEVKNRITDLFFPNGLSILQGLHLKDLITKLVTFTGDEVPGLLETGEEFSLEAYLKDRPNPVRLYIETMPIDEREDESEPAAEPSTERPTVETRGGRAPRLSLRRQPAQSTISNPNAAQSDVPLESSTTSAEQPAVTTHTPTCRPTEVNESMILEEEILNEHMSDDELPQILFDSGTPTVTFNCNRNLPDATLLPIGAPEESSITSKSLFEELTLLESNVNEESKNLVNVCREDVLDGALRAFSRSSFKVWQPVNVKFVDEDGIDAGGPKREFMRLLLKCIKQSTVFEGPEDSKMISLDYNCLHKNRYFITGKMLAYLIVHRGPLPRFFSPLFFTIIAEGRDKAVASTEDIIDNDLQSLVRQIKEASSEEQYRTAISKAEDVLNLAGCLNFCNVFSEERKTALTQALCRFLVIDRLRGPFEQFEEGLATMGLLERIRSNCNLWKEAFVFTPDPLDPTQIIQLFQTTWSEEGSNKRRAEKRTTTYWRDLLEDLVDGLTGPMTGRQLNLKDILSFVTGADKVPVLGFDPCPAITFIHPGDAEIHMKGMPTVNTCAMELRLPVVESFDEFKNNMLSALDVATTFSAE